MSDQPTPHLSYVESRILDQLQDWFDLAAMPAESLPTARQINDVRAKIEALRIDDPERAEDFNVRLKQIEQGTAQRYRDEIASGLDELAKVSAADVSWISTFSRIERALGEVEAITGAQERDAKKRVVDLRKQLEGEAIKLEAVQYLHRTKAEISSREKQSMDLASLPSDAKNLWQRMQKYLDNAMSKDAQPAVLAELRKHVEDSADFYDLKRRSHELAVTTDANDDHEDTLLGAGFFDRGLGVFG